MFKKIGGLSIPLFFIWPIGGFISSLFDFRSKSSAFVYVAFAMLFGYAISFSDSSADSYRYAEAFSRFDNTLNVNTIVQMYRDGELRDMYRLILFYFTSLFTNNPKVVYAFAGLVYGIFSYKCLSILVEEQGKKWDGYFLILATVFYTFVSLTNINAFRFNTGALVLFYSMYQLIIRGRLPWIIGVAATPLFHYGFILMVPIVIFYYIIAKTLYTKESVRPILFYAFIIAFILSFALGTNAINLGFLSESDALSGAAKSRIDFINSDKVTEIYEQRKGTSIFLIVQEYFATAIKIFVFVAIVFLWKLLKKATGDKSAYTKLFAFVLFFYSVSFIASSIPSGGRFLSIAHLFLLVLLAKFYKIYQGKNIKRVIFLALPVFSFIITFINFMLPYLILSKTFWYGNVFWIIIEGLGFSV